MRKPITSAGSSKWWSWITIFVMLFVLIYSCSENQRPLNNPSADNDFLPRRSVTAADAEPAEEIQKIDTCSIDVFIPEKEFDEDTVSVKEKLILQYEYCKVLYSPKVIIEEDTLRKCTVYRQIWPPIMIKAQLFATRSDKKPYRCLMYQVQKEKEDYRIDEKGTVELAEEDRDKPLAAKS